VDEDADESQQDKVGGEEDHAEEISLFAIFDRQLFNALDFVSGLLVHDILKI